MYQKVESQPVLHPVVTDITDKIQALSKKFESISNINQFFENQKKQMNASLDNFQSFTAAQKLGMWISRRNLFTKIVGGALIAAPLIAGGVLGHFVYLIVGGAIFAAFYLPTIMFVDSLGGKISESKEINKMLKGFIDIYYNCIKHLKEIEIEFETCVDELHKEVENIRNENKEFKKQNVQLESCNEEYKKLNNKLSLKIEALNATIQNLSENLDLSETQKNEFFQKLNDFLAEKGASFDKIFDRFGKAERALEVERQRFESLSLKYEELYNLFDANIKILNTDIQWLNVDIKDIKETKLSLADELENVRKILEQNTVAQKRDKKFISELKSKEKTLRTTVNEKDKELLKKTKELQDLEKRFKEVSQGAEAFKENKKFEEEMTKVFADNKETFFKPSNNPLEESKVSSVKLKVV